MPQLVNHAHADSCIAIGCNLLQPRATSNKKWLQSHRSCITVAVTSQPHHSHHNVKNTLHRSLTLTASSGKRTVRCPSVCICLSRRQPVWPKQQWRAADLLHAGVGGDIDRRLLPAAELSSGQRQCCDPRRIDADLLSYNSRFLIFRFRFSVVD